MTGHMIGAYALWLFFGWCSAHRFFLGRTKTAFRQMGLLIGSIVFTVVAVWGSESYLSMRSLQEMEFERVLFLLVGAFMFIAWNLWLLADLVLIPLIVLDEERKAGVARAFATAPVAVHPGRARSDNNVQSSAVGFGEAAPRGYSMPWRQEKDEEQEIYKARGD